MNKLRSTYENDTYFRCELLKVLREIAKSLKEPRKCRKKIEELEKRILELEKDIKELYGIHQLKYDEGRIQ